jgi:ribosomal protein S12 methylthiotransferase accessory factor
MDVRYAGTGPAAEAVASALSDLDDASVSASVSAVAPSGVGGADLAVVCGRTDGSELAAAHRSVVGTETAWVGVEIGGVGGCPVAGVRASVAGFERGAGCYNCLGSRVLAGEPDVDDAYEGGEDRSVARLAGAVAGREVVAVATGEDARVFRDVSGTRFCGVVEVPGTERTYLPVPGCDCAEWSRSFTLDDGERRRPLEAAVDRAELALDDRVGPVTNVGEAESFPVPYYLAGVCDTTVFSDGAAAQQAAGVDGDWNRAFMKALGEALERYSAGVYREEEFRRAPPGAMLGGVSPAAFVRPTDASAVDPETPIRWCPALDLVDDEKAYLPAEAVHYPPPERRYLTQITTGLGLGSSAVEAVLSGLYEVVERDATMIAWYSTFEALSLSVDDDDYRTLARRARSEGLSVTALLVTVDVDVPVVAAAVHREGDWPRFAAGSAADLDPAAAARSALAEALQNWTELRSMGPDGAAEDESAVGRYAEFPAAVRSFVDADGPVPASSVSDPDGVDTPTEELETLVGRVDDAGLRPYVADVTPRDVDRAGFTAVRVVVPEAQPLFTDRAYFGDRARRVPDALGFDPDLDREPHPFP